jgi:hypothetical protein
MSDHDELDSKFHLKVSVESSGGRTDVYYAAFGETSRFSYIRRAVGKPVKYFLLAGEGNFGQFLAYRRQV